MMNDGFRGVGVEAGKSYVFSVLARRVAGGPSALRVEVRDTGGRSYASGRVEGFDAGVGTLLGHADAEGDAGARPDGADGRRHRARWTWTSCRSSRPRPTRAGRGGLRKDLGEMLEALKPGFLRFPGGCIVEGRYLETRYQWKNTIGDPADRTLIINRWNDEFEHRPAPDYFQSFGLGLLRVLPARARTSAPSRCRSSTAAWPASSTPASSCRWTGSTRTSRTRST